MRADLRGGGASRTGLAGRAGAAGPDRRAGPVGATVRPAAVRGAPRRGCRRLRARAVRDPAARRAGRGSGRRSRGGVHLHQPVGPADGAQRAAQGRPAGGLLPGADRPRVHQPAGSRPLPFLDEHARHLGSRPPVRVPGAQRRDQHRSRQRQLAVGARATALQRAVRPRPAEALPGRRRAVVGLRQARCRHRAAGARRPIAAPRTGHAGARRMDRPDARARRRGARLLRVPRRAGRALGRPGGPAGERRAAAGRGARPQRPAPTAVRAEPRRARGDRF